MHESSEKAMVGHTTKNTMSHQMFCILVQRLIIA